jgi:hypothetical protein
MQTIADLTNRLDAAQEILSLKVDSEGNLDVGCLN